VTDGSLSATTAPSTDPASGDEEEFASIFNWYNEVHYHSGIGYLRPADLHTGNHTAIIEHRQAALDAAYAAHPERFTARPHPAKIPTTARISRPSIQTS